MNKDLKLLAKQLLLWGFLLAATQLLVFVGLSSLAAGATLGKVITYQFYSPFINDLLGLGFLFFVLFRLAKRMNEVNFGKLIVYALIFLIFSYHLWFLFRLIYFYATHPGYVAIDIRYMEMGTIVHEMGKHGLNIFPPRYELNDYLFGEFKRIVLFFNYSLQFVMLLLNPVLLSLWVSGVIWLLTKKKNQDTHKESTLDN